MLTVGEEQESYCKNNFIYDNTNVDNSVNILHSSLGPSF